MSYSRARCGADLSLTRNLAWALVAAALLVQAGPVQAVAAKPFTDMENASRFVTDLSAVPSAATAVAAAFYPPLQSLELFAVDSDGTLKDVWKGADGAWRPSFNVTGPGFAPAGAPLAAVYYPPLQSLEVYAVDKDGYVKGAWKGTDGAWHTFNVTVQGGFAPAGAALDAIYYPPLQSLEVFAVAGEGQLRSVWKGTEGKWQQFDVTSGAFAPAGAPISAAYYPPLQSLEVFAIAKDGRLKDAWKGIDGQWQFFDASSPEFAPAGAALKAAYYEPIQTLEVFAIDRDGSMKDAWKGNEGKWQTFKVTSRGNFVPSGAALTAVYYPSSEQLEVFGARQDGHLRGVWKGTAGEWHAPFSVTTSEFVTGGAPVAAVYEPVNEQLEVFGVTPDRAVRGVWKAHNGAWQPPFDITRPGFAAAFRASPKPMLVRTPLAVVRQALNEHLELFAIDIDGVLKDVWNDHDRDVWWPAFGLTAPGFAAPGASVAAVYYPPLESVEVFAIDDSGTLKGVWKAHDGPWQAPFNVTGPGFAPPGAPLTAIYYPPLQSLEIFAVDKDGFVKSAWKGADGNWHTFNVTSRGGFAPAGAPVSAVYYPPLQSLEVFAIDGDGTVRDVWKGVEGAWQSFTVSSAGFAPAAASVSAVYYPPLQSLEVFAVNGDGAVRDVWKGTDGKWQSFDVTSKGGFAPPGAAITGLYEPTSDQALRVFGVAADGTVNSVYKQADGKWTRQPVPVSGRAWAPPGAPVAAVFQPYAHTDYSSGTAVSEHGEAFVADRYQRVWRLPAGTVIVGEDADPTYLPRRNLPLLTKPGLTPALTVGDCARFFKEWAGPGSNDSKTTVCESVMGMDKFCTSQGMYVTVAQDPDTNKYFLSCTPKFHDDTVLEQIGHIGRGIAEGLNDALVASAPFLGPVIEGATCISGVFFGCAALAVDVLSEAELPLLKDVPPEAINIAKQVSGCVGGDTIACVQGGAELASRAGNAVGVTIPGRDVALVAENLEKCRNNDAVACARLVLWAGDAAGVPEGGVITAGAIDVQACMAGDGAACIAVGRAAQRAGVPLGGAIGVADAAIQCGNGDENACGRAGLAFVAALAKDPELAGPLRDCVTDDVIACVRLGLKAARSANLNIPGMDTADVGQNAARCTNNDVQACWLLGRMAGTALHAPTGASSEAAFDVRACIAGDPAACDSLGRAAQKAGLPVGGLSQGAENAQRCATGDRPACARLGRSIAAAVS